MKNTNDKLFNYLMDNTSGFDFENFIKRLFSAHFGEEFIPLGGIHDGGADGALSSYIKEVKGKHNTFIQISTTSVEKISGKITNTIAALRKAGRDPRQIIYVTNKFLPKADVIAQEIFDTENVMLQVRDRERIKRYINENEQCNVAYYDHFKVDIESLSKAAESNITTANPYAKDPTVYVFLKHEIKNDLSKEGINKRVLDALIYWSLRDTDPSGVKLTSDEISTAIGNAFPIAKSVLLPHLNSRLSDLSKKGSQEIERLRYYSSEKAYCLPFDLRRELAEDNSETAEIINNFNSSIKHRINSEQVILSSSETDACIEVINLTVQQYFIEQGLLLSSFIQGKISGESISEQIVEDLMVKSISDSKTSKVFSPKTFSLCMSVLRGLFYRPTEEERDYLLGLSKTSCLMVTLQSSPKMLEYLNKMGGDFHLFVGSDLLIKALTEQHLEQPHKHVTNMLHICKELGSELVLTEPVLNEVFTHFHATDLEFRNNYMARELYLSATEVAECDRILIRAYFHAKTTDNGPKSWAQFVNKITDPTGLRNKSIAAKNGLRGVLLQSFGMKYETTESLEEFVSKKDVLKLAATIREKTRDAKHKELAYNDALMAYATYAYRKAKEETGIYDGFGFRTWWLTKETHIIGLTNQLVKSEGGIHYVMRPEFILNFIALSPKAADARKIFKSILPTTAGIQLGKHLPSNIMHKLLDSTKEWSELSPERISVLLSEKANELRFDRFKKYLHNI